MRKLLVIASVLLCGVAVPAMAQQQEQDGPLSLSAPPPSSSSSLWGSTGSLFALGGLAAGSIVLAVALSQQHHDRDRPVSP